MMGLARQKLLLDPGRGPATITFVVPGKPIAKMRPRFANRGKYVAAINDQVPEEGLYILCIQDQIRNQAGLSGLLPFPSDIPISLRMIFSMPPLKSFSKRKTAAIQNGAMVPHVSRPDLDNCIKFTKDCLNGIAWVDDNQVSQIIAEKVYAARLPSTQIEITPLPGVRL